MSTQLRRTAATIRAAIFREPADPRPQIRPAPQKAAKAGRANHATDACGLAAAAVK